MSMIKSFNKAISNAINKQDETYTALIGVEGFVPEVTIEDSEDFNCGALCNELEYLRSVSNYYVQSFDLDIAEDTNLDLLVQGFLNLPRRYVNEKDYIYRNRFRSIVVEKSNPRRTTKWAIIDAVSYFITDKSKIQVIEQFDTDDLYFQLRIEGAVDYDESIFLNNQDQGFVNQNYIGGQGIGAILTYLGAIIDRIKAVGVDYDILFISQDQITKTSDCIIGSVQLYKGIDGMIKRSESFTKTVDATVV